MPMSNGRWLDMEPIKKPPDTSSEVLRVPARLGDMDPRPHHHQLQRRPAHLRQWRVHVPDA